MWTLIIYFKQPYAVDSMSILLDDLTGLDWYIEAYNESTVEKIHIERVV